MGRFFLHTFRAHKKAGPHPMVALYHYQDDTNEITHFFMNEWGKVSQHEIEFMVEFTVK